MVFRCAHCCCIYSSPLTTANFCTPGCALGFFSDAESTYNAVAAKYGDDFKPTLSRAPSETDAAYWNRVAIAYAGAYGHKMLQELMRTRPELCTAATTADGDDAETVLERLDAAGEARRVAYVRAKKRTNTSAILEARRQMLQ